MKSISIFVFATLSLVNLYAGGHKYPEPKSRPHLYISHYENVLGTSLEIKISASSKQEATNAENAALNEISRLAKILSGYDTASEFSRWLITSRTPVRVSHELFEVLGLFDQWRLRTGGALDASAAVINTLWKQAAARRQIPTNEELAEAVSEVKQVHWQLDTLAQTATHLSRAPLMLNSFAKSYIIRRAADAALAAGKLSAIVVNIGGDMVVSGNVNERVLITDPKADAENETPMDQLMINNKAVATSGNYRRGELIAGHWYSHIVDPRTGMPSDNIISATVVAKDATDAGALATAFNVMSVSESKKLAATIPGVEYLIVTAQGKRVASPGWGSLESPVNSSAANDETKASKGSLPKGWNNDFELDINLEISLPAQGFAKRPYVAVWVEDENHYPVRTISVWHGSDRYMQELKSWFLKYRSQYNADKNFNSSVSSATRSPGKYTLKWDGKDDQGNFVKPGKYVVKIEASREHGTYQLMRQEIECNDQPKQISLAGNVEIGSASLDYHKKINNN
jgi:FAD:protein FMN transferase